MDEIDLDGGSIKSPKSSTGEDDQIDDPIRIYLMQMGEIPLLSRNEEMDAARQIERSRTRFRYTMLATDYVLQAAIDLLREHSRRPAPAGPHDRGLGDQPPREAAADEGCWGRTCTRSIT